MRRSVRVPMYVRSSVVSCLHSICTVMGLGAGLACAPAAATSSNARACTERSARIRLAERRLL